LTALVFAVNFGHAQESSEPAIAMSLKPNGKITFYIAGITAVGPIVIDWGDGSPAHTQQLFPFNQKYDEKVHAVSHTYSTNSVCTISITGKGITCINCDGLGLTSLILNVPIMRLDCSENQLTSLDVSKSGLLTLLACRKNQLKSLNVSQNIYLGILNCSHNQLNGIDVSKNTILQSLQCYNNQLTSLDVGKNLQLIMLDCSNNQLTEEALDALFASLNSTPNKTPTAGNPVIPKQITIDGNPGTDACQKNIAIDKSWIVRGTKQEEELLNARRTTVTEPSKSEVNARQRTVTEPSKSEGSYKNKTEYTKWYIGGTTGITIDSPIIPSTFGLHGAYFFNHKYGVGLAVRNFKEEYYKEIVFAPAFFAHWGRSDSKIFFPTRLGLGLDRHIYSYAEKIGDPFVEITEILFACYASAGIAFRPSKLVSFGVNVEFASSFEWIDAEYLGFSLGVNFHF